MNYYDKTVPLIVPKFSRSTNRVNKSSGQFLLELDYQNWICRILKASVALFAARDVIDLCR